MKKFFESVGRWMKKHKVITILLVIVLIAAVVGTLLLTGVIGSSSETAAQVQQNTVALSKMDLTSSVSATGTIESAKTKIVSANVSNVEVKSVKVSEGDEVTKGQTLVTFDEADLRDTLSDAQDSLSDTQTQNANSLSSAQRQLSDAKSTYSSEKTKLAKSVSTAKSTYQTAKKTVASLKKKVAAASGSAKTQLQSELEKAQSTLVETNKSYEQAVSEQTSSNKQNQSSIESAKDNVTTTQSNNKKSLKEAQSAVDDAKEALEACSVTAPMAGTITAVGVEAGDTYSGGDLFEISDCMDLQVSTTVDEYDITNVKKGQKVVILTDATDEDEIEGKITYVALTTGSSSLSSSSSSSSGTESSAGAGGTSTSTTTSSSSGYAVTIKISKADSRLRVGMTAKCSIILDEASDVYAVPYDAIHTNNSGESVIYAVDRSASSTGSTDSASGGAMKAGRMGGFSGNGGTTAQKEIVVTKGMESDYYVEISGDDLSEGLQIIIPSDSTSTSSDSSSESSDSGLSSMMGGMSSQRNKSGMSGGGGAPSGGGPGM